jgi:hypothetical protein
VDAGGVESAEPFRKGRKADVVGEELGHAADEVSGVIENGMMVKSKQRKLGTTRGQPRRTRTAKASRITRTAAKSRRASEWGGWGRLSVDGPGHYNPDRSEGPWGRARYSRLNSGVPPVMPSGSERNTAYHLENAKGAYKPLEAQGMPGAGLTAASRGKVPPDKLALKPYWGKPAVRNFREGDGNAGHHRSPVSAFVLPDWISFRIQPVRCSRHRASGAPDFFR